MSAATKFLQVLHHIEFNRICKLHKLDHIHLSLQTPHITDLYPHDRLSRDVYWTMHRAALRINSLQTTNWRNLLKSMLRNIRLIWQDLSCWITPLQRETLANHLTLYVFNQAVLLDTRRQHMIAKHHNVHPKTGADLDMPPCLRGVDGSALCVAYTGTDGTKFITARSDIRASLQTVAGPGVASQPAPAARSERRIECEHLSSARQPTTNASISDRAVASSTESSDDNRVADADLNECVLTLGIEDDEKASTCSTMAITPAQPSQQTSMADLDLAESSTADVAVDIAATDEVVAFADDGDSKSDDAPHRSPYDLALKPRAANRAPHSLPDISHIVAAFLRPKPAPKHAVASVPRALKFRYDVEREEAIRFCPPAIIKNYVAGYELPPNLARFAARSGGFVMTTDAIDFHDLHVGIANWEWTLRLQWFIAHWDDESCPRWIRNMILFGILGDHEGSEYSSFNKNSVDDRERKHSSAKTSCHGLESFVAGVRSKLLNGAIENQKTKTIKLNYSPDDAEAIEEYRKQNEIKLVEEDKGSLYAAQKTADYAKVTHETILASNMVEIEGYDMQAQQEEILKLLAYWFERGDIRKDWLKTLYPRGPVEFLFGAARNYAVQKTHKKTAVKPMRIITSSCQSMLRPVQKFITEHIKPIWKKLEFLIRDSKSVVSEIGALNDILIPEIRANEQQFLHDAFHTIIALFFEQYILHIAIDTCTPCELFEDDELKNYKLLEHLSILIGINELELSTEQLICDYRYHATQFILNNTRNATAIDAHTLPTNQNVLVASPNMLSFELFDWRSAIRFMIVSLDIKALYPSLTHEFVVRSLDYYWDKYSHLMPTYPSKECIKSLLLYCLKNIVSEFNGRCYLKTKGEGQGEDYAAQAADIPVSIIMEHAHDKEWLKGVTDLLLYYMGAYRDDVLNLCRGTFRDIERLVDGLSLIEQGIVFTNELSLGGLQTDFLDLTVYLTRHGLRHCSYSKPTDDRLYVPPSSMHISHQTRNIPKSVLMKTRALNDDLFVHARAYAVAMYLIRSEHDPRNVGAEVVRWVNKSKEKVLKQWVPRYGGKGRGRRGRRRSGSAPNSAPTSRSIAKNKRIMHPSYDDVNNDAMQDALAETVVVQQSERAVSASDGDSDAEESALRDFWLIRKAHPNHVSLYDVVEAEWNQHIKPCKELAVMYPLSHFKEGWRRGGRTLRELLVPHNFSSQKREELSEVDKALRLVPYSTPTPGDDTTITLFGRQLVIAKLEEWTGFQCCEELELSGTVIKNKAGRKCNCFSRSEYARKRKSFVNIVGIKRRIPQRITCFSANCIYAMTCKCCGQQYFGKEWEGAKSDNLLRDRLNGHLSVIKTAFEKLQKLGLYDSDGRIVSDPIKRAKILTEFKAGIDDLSEHIAAHRHTDHDEHEQKEDESGGSSVFKMIKKMRKRLSNWTGDVSHALGLDGSSCYLQMEDNSPSSIFEMFGTEVVVERSPDCIQAALHKHEQMAQSSNCSIYNGLNGTSDWNYIGDFTKETSKITKSRNRMQWDDDGKQIITEHVSDAARLKVRRSIEAAASLNHLQLSLPINVRITNTDDPNVHCLNGHPLVEFTVKSLRTHIRKHELQRHDADKYGAYLSETIWCDRCEAALARRECKVYHCGWRGCVFDVCEGCYTENHHDARLYPEPMDTLVMALSSDEDADGASENEC